MQYAAKHCPYIDKLLTINVIGEQSTCFGVINITSVLQILTNSLQSMNKQFLGPTSSLMQSIDSGKLQAALHELRYMQVYQ